MNNGRTSQRILRRSDFLRQFLDPRSLALGDRAAFLQVGDLVAQALQPALELRKPCLARGEARMRFDDLAIESAEAFLRLLNVGGERCFIELPGGADSSQLVLPMNMYEFAGND